MKPQRMRMTHELVSVYGMIDKMSILVRLTIYYIFLLFHDLVHVESEAGDRRTDDQIPHGRIRPLPAKRDAGDV